MPGNQLFGACVGVNSLSESILNPSVFLKETKKGTVGIFIWMNTETEQQQKKKAQHKTLSYAGQSALLWDHCIRNKTA